MFLACNDVFQFYVWNLGASLSLLHVLSLGKTGEGVSILRGIFNCLVVTGIVGNFLGVLFVDLTSDVEERIINVGSSLCWRRWLRLG